MKFLNVQLMLLKERRGGNFRRGACRIAAGRGNTALYRQFQHIFLYETYLKNNRRARRRRGARLHRVSGTAGAFSRRKVGFRADCRKNRAYLRQKDHHLRG